jgi:hypothetical protein
VSRSNALDRLPIAAWPGQAMPFFRYRRRRYRLDEGERSLVGDLLDAPPAEADGETYLRFAEIELEDNAFLAFANAAGTVGLSGGPESQTLAEFHLTAQVIRDAVTAWRLVQREPTLETPQWELPRFVAAGDDVDELALEFLNVTLTTGLEQFRFEIALGQVEDDVRDLSLFSLCCLELHNHVVGRIAYARCANETCRRLFAPTEAGRRRGVLYCSRACARAQAQREFRRRRRDETASKS